MSADLAPGRAWRCKSSSLQPYEKQSTKSSPLKILAPEPPNHSGLQPPIGNLNFSRTTANHHISRPEAPPVYAVVYTN